MPKHQFFGVRRTEHLNAFTTENPFLGNLLEFGTGRGFGAQKKKSGAISAIAFVKISRNKRGSGATQYPAAGK